MNINVPGGMVAGQAVNITATGGSGNGGPVTWNSSLGSSFSPNPSPDSGGGVYATTYTPGGAGLDTVSASDSDPTDNASTDVTVTAGGGGGGGGGSTNNLTDASLLAAAAAMNSVADFTQTAACAPVKAFQARWNALGNTPALTVDGGYGVNTATANGQVAAANGGGQVQGGLSGGWPNCGGGSPNPPAPPPPNPGPIAPSSGMPKWAKWLLGVIIVAGLAGALYWAFGTEHGKKTLGMQAAEKKKNKKNKKNKGDKGKKK